MPLIAGAEPFRVEGDDLGFLVLHGFAGTPASVRPWAEYLAEAGHTVVAPRLPGHGTRWQDLNATSWQDWYTEAERNAEWLRRRCTALVVAGLGAGATLALRLAEDFDEAVAGLVLVNPVVQSERYQRHVLPTLHRVLPSLPWPSDDVKRAATAAGGYDRMPLRAAHSMTRLWSVVKSDIHKVGAPLLLFRSADDHVVEPSNSAWILANVASQTSTEVVLENSYHVATLDNDAETIFAGSLAFAEGLHR